jgi:hypothetical protein
MTGERARFSMTVGVPTICGTDQLFAAQIGHPFGW